MDCATVDGPKPTKDAEKGGFAATVGADDEEMVTLFEGKGESFDKDVAIGGDDWTVRYIY